MSISKHCCLKNHQELKKKTLCNHPQVTYIFGNSKTTSCENAKAMSRRHSYLCPTRRWVVGPAFRVGITLALVEFPSDYWKRSSIVISTLVPTMPQRHAMSKDIYNATCVLKNECEIFKKWLDKVIKWSWRLEQNVFLIYIPRISKWNVDTWCENLCENWYKYFFIFFLEILEWLGKDVHCITATMMSSSISRYQWMKSDRNVLTKWFSNFGEGFYFF